jgi:hypothetical protein
MLIDYASHKRWMLLTAAAAVLAVSSWWWLDRRTPEGLTGGSIPGLWYALFGSLLMLFAGLLSAVRHFPRWRLPPRNWWLKGHIWLGLLSGVLILCHSSFRFGGPLEKVLYLVLGLTLATGIFGLLLQQVLPRQLAIQVPNEASHEQIPHLCEVMRRRADTLMQQVGQPSAEATRVEATTLQVSRYLNTARQVLEFYERQVRPFLDEHYQRSSPLAQPFRARATFENLVALSGGGDLGELVGQLQALCEERRLLGEQERLHYWLHGWLALHIPLSVLLLFLGVAHAAVALWY